MTAFFKGKGVSQIDSIIVDGQTFYEEQIRELLKDVVAKKLSKKK